MANKKEVDRSKVPEWFYFTSILAVFLFTIYISIYSAIHFETMFYMNVALVFLFIAFISFFLVSAVYFHMERLGFHKLASLLYFAGITALVIYGYKAADASNITRYSIMYSIIVTGISLFVLLTRKSADSISASKKKSKGLK